MIENGARRVVRAEALGMCFGVRDALDVARRLSDPESTTVYGELVHNESVQKELAARGFRQLSETGREQRPQTKRLLITAHGISDRERARLTQQGHQLVDTTCPLVGLAHRAARELAAEGRRVLVLGRAGHVEVLGLTGDLPLHSVIESKADVRTWPEQRLGILCQTTLPEALAQDLRREIRLANPTADIRFRDTICEPTKERQRAIEQLVNEVEAVVVVGGCNSNNTKQLVRSCEAAGRPAFHVQGPEDLPHDRLRKFQVIGLTAGTSTTPACIDAVERALLEHAEEHVRG